MKYLLAVLLLAINSCSQIYQQPVDTVPGEPVHLVENSPQEKPESTPSIQPESEPLMATERVQNEPLSVVVEMPATAGEDDLWQRIRAGYQLNQPNQPRLLSELAWYARNQDYLDRVANRANRYLYFIVELLEHRGMPLELALLPIVESAFDPFAYSHGQAMGIWQFIPGTGRHYGLKQNWWYDGRRDIIASTNAALNYLEDLYNQFDQDWELALAAYNSGAGNVRSAIKKNRRRGKPTDFWSLSLPKETRLYVPKLLAIARLVKNPDQFKVKLQSLPDRPYWTRVDVGSQIDLSKMAELAEVDIDEIYRLNPGFNQWATHPDGPHELLIPASKTEVFERNKLAMTDQDRIGWRRHKIRAGESLGLLASHYNTSIDIIREVNGVKGNMIRAGDSLLIPVALHDPDRYSLSREGRQKSSLNSLQNKYDRPPIHYTVKEKDSLWTISRAFRVDLRSLAKWNSMATTDTLYPGRTLSIFESSATKTSSKHPGTIRKLKYRVRSGDSLSRIASKFNVTVNKIKGWNDHLVGRKYIQPGDRLTLFVDVTQSKL